MSTIINPYDIKRSKIHSLKGRVPYTVLYLPQNFKIGVLQNYFYLRTALTIDRAVDQASKEFKGYGFKPRYFTPDYNKGSIYFGKEEIIIKQRRRKTISHWVAEALVWHFYKEKELEMPKIRTERNPTKKLYNIPYEDEPLKESKKDLVELITSKDKACVIRLAPAYSNGYFGLNRTTEAIRNCSSHFAQYATFFHDPDTRLWYGLLLKQRAHGLVDSTRCCLRLNKIKKMGSEPIIAALHKFGMVGNFAGSYFFDGSLQDIFEILKKSGIKLEIN